MKEEDRIFGDQTNERGNDFRESARAPNARSCNHRNSTETRGDRFRSWLFEFNGRIVSCRIARLVRSIRASTINAAPPTRRKSRRERNLLAWIRIDRIVFQRLWRRKKKKQKKNVCGGALLPIVKVDQPRFRYPRTRNMEEPYMILQCWFNVPS